MVEHNKTVAEQDTKTIRWTKFDDPKPHVSGKVVVCGHASQKDGIPKNLGHSFCIDTFAYGGGWLTCLDLTNGIYYQAKEKGKIQVIPVNNQ